MVTDCKKLAKREIEFFGEVGTASSPDHPNGTRGDLAEWWTQREQEIIPVKSTELEAGVKLEDLSDLQLCTSSKR